jgi:hypothetical protein
MEPPLDSQIRFLVFRFQRMRELGVSIDSKVRAGYLLFLKRILHIHIAEALWDKFFATG